MTSVLINQNYNSINSRSLTEENNKKNKIANKYLERANKLNYEYCEKFVDNTLEDIIFGSENIYNINKVLFNDIQKTIYWEQKVVLIKGSLKSITYLLNKSAIHNVALAVTSNFKDSNILDSIKPNECWKILHDPYNNQHILSSSVIEYLDSGSVKKDDLFNYIKQNNHMLAEACKENYCNNDIMSFTSQNMYRPHSVAKEFFALLNGANTIPMEDTIAKIVFEKAIQKIKNDILDHNPDDYFENIPLDKIDAYKKDDVFVNPIGEIKGETADNYYAE